MTKFAVILAAVLAAAAPATAGAKVHKHHTHHANVRVALPEPAAGTLVAQPPTSKGVSFARNVALEYALGADGSWHATRFVRTHFAQGVSLGKGYALIYGGRSVHGARVPVDLVKVRFADALTCSVVGA